MCSALTDVRFAPESRHVQRTSRCPLSANSGHCQHRVDDDAGNRTGTVRVACSNGATVAVPLPATRTSGASAANSAACLRRSSELVVAQRVSMRTLRPMRPAQRPSALMERLDAGLKFRIVRGCEAMAACRCAARARSAARARRAATQRLCRLERQEIPAVSCQSPFRRRHRAPQTSALIRAADRLRYCNMRCLPMPALG